MKVMTLRNLSVALSRAIRRKVDEARSSIRKTVIDLCEETVGIGLRHKRKRIPDDLHGLAGAWTKDETAVFSKALQAQRRINAELWK